MSRHFKSLTNYFLSRLEFVSDISKDVAQVCFGALAVETLTKEIISWRLVTLGVVLSSIWWIVGIITFQIKK